jgi:hypothetical protein
MKVLRAGGEHREDHPQLVLVTTTTDEGTGTGGLDYPAGGSFAEGDGYIRTNMTGWEASTNWAWIRADYRIMPSRELWIHVDIRPMETNSLGGTFQAETRTRIGWDSSNNSDPGYVEISHFGNTLKWSWSGGSGSKGKTITKNTWYHIKVHVKVDAGGNEIVTVWLDGVREFHITQDLTVGYTLIDRVFCYSYNRDSVVNNDPQPRAGFDNLAVNNVAGASQNTDPGKLYLLGRTITGPGLWEMWSRGGGNSGSNSAQVDEVPPDETLWVYSLTPSDKDAHAMENLPATVDGESFTIGGFGIRTWAKVANAIAGGIAGIVCLGGGSIPVYSGGSQPHATAYGPPEYWFRLNPDTNAEWQASEVDALQPGYRVDT